ncbi:hypothetical protein [Streptococcus orisasini]|uniref:hypothetical protein n=1 Tax=Streptococcus orisasini TaxID=1080071 RepID=UPI00070CC1E7|nr:hypothetical protein [Streptococcus orisasini]
MVSYEKVRQSLKTSTIVIAVLNILSIILGLMGILSALSLRRAFQDGTINKFHLSANQLTAIKQSITSTAIMITIVALIVDITIVAFCFINLSKLKQEQTVSLIPYYLGIALSTANIAYIIIFNQIALIPLLIQAAYIVLYFYAIQKAKTLSEKEE